MSDDENKIAIFRAESEFPVRKREKPHCRCSQFGQRYGSGEFPAVWIDEATRDVECRHCGARISAFDFVWLLATTGHSIYGEVRRLEENKQALKAQIGLLNEQKNELLSANRRLAKGQKPIEKEPEIKPNVVDMKTSA